MTMRLFLFGLMVFASLIALYFYRGRLMTGSSPDHSTSARKVAEIYTIGITLDVNAKRALFLMLSADGSINRQGSGTFKDMAHDLFVGITDSAIFESVRSHLTDDMLQAGEQCDSCGQRAISYNSCLNRHCPKCQAAARQRWLEKRSAERLPVPYYHVVFTLPHVLAPLALQNKALVYGLLFRAAAQTLLQIAADPKHLGADIGFLAVLHTWGQTLLAHPHLHCVVPGGGLSPDHQRWIPCGPKFFLPVKVLRLVFQGKFLAGLERAFKKHKLTLAGQLAPLQSPAAFAALLRTAAQPKWVVYAKRPFAGPAQVLTYLSRYTHRIAIANSRFLAMDQGKVTFRWRDYAHGYKTRFMTLDADEFLRRFLLHVLPQGFVRIRYFGLLANRRRTELIDLCRHHLRTTAPPPVTVGVAHLCQHCRRGTMRVVETLSPTEPDRPG